MVGLMPISKFSLPQATFRRQKPQCMKREHNIHTLAATLRNINRRSQSTQHIFTPFIPNSNKSWTRKHSKACHLPPPIVPSLKSANLARNQHHSQLFPLTIPTRRRHPFLTQSPPGIIHTISITGICPPLPPLLRANDVGIRLYQPARIMPRC